MARRYTPVEAHKVEQTLTCPCGASVTGKYAPSPNLDEGWPLHVCRDGRPAPFTTSIAPQVRSLPCYNDDLSDRREQHARTDGYRSAYA